MPILTHKNAKFQLMVSSQNKNLGSVCCCIPYPKENVLKATGRRVAELNMKADPLLSLSPSFWIQRNPQHAK